MSRKLVKFGSLCAAFEGNTALLDGSYLCRFFAESGTPAFTVSLQFGELPSLQARHSLINQKPPVYRTENGWFRPIFNHINGEDRNYAALSYTDTSAELTISPVCTNIPACVEGCIAFEHLALFAGALTLHASHIQMNGMAIAFTAPSGVGKSTQAALWERHRGAFVVNGDKTLLVKTPQGFVASGLPYAGTSGICHNAAAPLQAVVVLEQGRENTVERLYGARAAMRLMPGVIRNAWHDEDAQRALELVAELVETTPVFLLRCLPDESAVRCLEAVI